MLAKGILAALSSEKNTSMGNAAMCTSVLRRGESGARRQAFRVSILARPPATIGYGESFARRETALILFAEGYKPAQATKSN